MKVQAFIFNWPGRKQHAVGLEAMFRPHCAVAVINSDDSLRIRHPHWHHIGNDAYFTEQWNAAIARFDADVFLHIQADVWPDKFAQMLSECIRCLTNLGIGIYAPNVNFNPHIFSRNSLNRLTDGIYEVPATDCSFWAISADVLRNTPAIDPKINKLGWGIDYLVGAVCKRRNLKIVRDYRFVAAHPKTRGYDNTQALREWNAFRTSVDPILRDEMDVLVKQRDKLVVNNSSRNLVVRASRALQSRFARGTIIFQRRLEAALTSSHSV
jgi:hypothetical protein